MKNIKITNATITINVRNLDQSISFYEVIGLDLHQRWDNHYAEMITSGIKIGLHPVQEPSPMNGSGSISIGFTCDDFEKTKSILLDESIAIKERNEEGGKFLHFSDPDGTSLYFIEPKW
jgi:catechol 2,3-dioxygenase-like lactoylglutathione lyase family enzyme